MKEVKTLADLTLPEEGFVELPREGESLRIPIRALSARESQEIMNRNRVPNPPQKFDKSGKMTVDGKPGWYLDEADPVYNELASEKREAQMYDMAVAAIPIPDLTPETLAERLTLGDISIILDATNSLSNIDVEEIKNSSSPE